MWLILATVAAGGGDVAFAVQLIEAIATRGPKRLLVCVCAQSSAEPAAAVEGILNGLLPTGKACVVAVRAAKRARDAAEPVSDWRVLITDFDFGGLSVRGVLQGPLRCFDNGQAAAAALCSPFPLAERPIPLLTVREFGQAAFCPPCPALSGGCWAPRDAWAAAPSKHLDVSSGLLPDCELGVFRIGMPSASDGARICIAQAPAASTEAGGAAGQLDAAAAAGASRSVALIGLPQLPYIVGYFRTERHCRQLGRLTAAFLRLSRMPARAAAEAAGTHAAAAGASSGGGGSAAPASAVECATAAQSVVVLTPFVTEAAFAAFRSGLADVGVASAAGAAAAGTVEAAGAASPAGEARPWSAHISCGSEKIAHASIVRSWACSLPDAIVSAESVTIHLLDTHAVRLSMQHFRCLLAGAAGAIVTGDASLNEALCCASAPADADGTALLKGLPFWYSAEPHKRDVDIGLRAAVAAEAVSRPIIALWDLLDAKTMLKAGDEAAVAPKWMGLCEVLHPSAPLAGLSSDCGSITLSAGASDTRWTALQQSFAAVASALLKRHGNLGERILCLIDDTA